MLAGGCEKEAAIRDGLMRPYKEPTLDFATAAARFLLGQTGPTDTVGGRRSYYPQKDKGLAQIVIHGGVVGRDVVGYRGREKE